MAPTRKGRPAVLNNPTSYGEPSMEASTVADKVSGWAWSLFSFWPVSSSQLWWAASSCAAFGIGAWVTHQYLRKQMEQMRVRLDTFDESEDTFANLQFDYDGASVLSDGINTPRLPEIPGTITEIPMLRKRQSSSEDGTRSEMSMAAVIPNARLDAGQLIAEETDEALMRLTRQSYHKQRQPRGLHKLADSFGSFGTMSPSLDSITAAEKAKGLASQTATQKKYFGQTARDYIEGLHLQRHAEGGFFIETYRSGAVPMSSGGRTDLSGQSMTPHKSVMLMPVKKEWRTIYPSKNVSKLKIMAYAPSKRRKKSVSSRALLSKPQKSGLVSKSLSTSSLMKDSSMKDSKSDDSEKELEESCSDAEILRKFEGEECVVRHPVTCIYWLQCKDTSLITPLHSTGAHSIHIYNNGYPCHMIVIDTDTWVLRRDVILGPKVTRGQQLQVHIPGHWWKALVTKQDFTLISEVCTPGFDYRDFNLISISDVLASKLSSEDKHFILDAKLIAPEELPDASLVGRGVDCEQPTNADLSASTVEVSS